ncbi:MAG: hypothetical protein Q8N77_03425 [Nanoarchaeota archaeon]|nr:hypothetical protein [Nanoarchaeota archaeon]
MFSIFPIAGPIMEGLKIIWVATFGELSSLISKNAAQSIWNLIKFFIFLSVVIVLSLLESLTVDFFRNIRDYWAKDFSHQ